MAQIQYAEVEPGWYEMACGVCGAAAQGPGDGVGAFARDHEHMPPGPSHYGLGDMVAGVTGAFGVEPCTPCEARQRALNNFMPNLWPRR